jgi:hypothetical protein
MTIPCENCLVLGSCIGLLTSNNLYQNNAYELIIKHLVPKCSLMQEYIDAFSYYNYPIHNRNVAIQFFYERCKWI